MFQKSDEQGPVELARQEIKRPFALEKDLTEKRRRKLADLDVGASAAVDAVLDGASIEAIAQRAIAVQTESRVLTQAIEVCRQRRRAAIKSRYEIEASELRKESAAKTAEADSILRKAAPLLAKLSELENVSYDSSILNAQRIGSWSGSLITGAPLSECNPFEGRPDIDASYAVPQSLALCREASQLETRAGQLAAREVAVDGSIVKSSVQEILGSDEFQNSESVTPAVYAVEVWAASCSSKIAKRSDLAAIRQRQYKLQWADGVIDPESSNVTVMTQNFSEAQPTFRAG